MECFYYKFYQGAGRVLSKNLKSINCTSGMLWGMNCGIVDKAEFYFTLKLSIKMSFMKMQRSVRWELRLGSCLFKQK